MSWLASFSTAEAMFLIGVVGTQLQSNPTSDPQGVIHYSSYFAQYTEITVLLLNTRLKLLISSIQSYTAA
jgi:hypothetical protein